MPMDRAGRTAAGRGDEADAQPARTGEYVELPGAHTFPWRDPAAWSQPIQRFAAGLP